MANMRLLSVLLALGCSGEVAIEDAVSGRAAIVNGYLDDQTPIANAVLWVDCTGTLVSPNTVLSAAHCVEWGIPNPARDGKWHLMPPEASTQYFTKASFGGLIPPVYRASVRYYNFLSPMPNGNTEDILLLGIDERIPATVAVPRAIAYDNPGITSGSTAFQVGYAPQTSRLRTFASGSGFTMALPPNGYRFRLTAPAYVDHGDSGGPLLFPSLSGAVTGVLNASSGNGYTWGVATFGQGNSEWPDVRSWLLSNAGEQQFARYGFVRGNQPTATEVYSPGPGASLNSVGGGATVERLGIGQYKVEFSGLVTTSGGHVQVSSYGSGPERCKVLTFGRSGSTMWAFVYCHQPSGAFVDAKFSAWVTGPGHLREFGAYLFADHQSTASYTPNPVYQWSASGALATVTRSGSGEYIVYLPNETYGAPQVTAVGSNSHYCKAAAMSIHGGGGIDLTVRCYNTSGSLADSEFLLKYDRGGLRGTFIDGCCGYPDRCCMTAHDPQPLGPAAYTWAYWYSSGIGTFYEGHPAFDYNGYGHYGGPDNPNQIRRTGTGEFEVFLPNRNSVYSAPIVTADGFNNIYCKPATWAAAGSLGPGTLLHVRCFSPTGVLTNMSFFATYVQDAARIVE